MALTATIYRMTVQLSDVDRSVYETLELRLALHPSETLRYMITRALAYALSYEDGIAFSKGGLSTADEPPLSIRDATGALVAWIDIGLPSAERLHKASKASQRVELYTAVDLSPLKKEMASRPIHRADELAVFTLDPEFISKIEERLERNTKLELTRTRQVVRDDRRRGDRGPDRSQHARARLSELIPNAARQLRFGRPGSEATADLGFFYAKTQRRKASDALAKCSRQQLSAFERHQNFRSAARSA